MKKVVVYVRNKYLRPSDYYRFIQYTKDLDCKVLIRSAVPDWLDRVSLSRSSNIPIHIISLMLCYLCILINFYRGYIGDSFFNPDCIVVIREIFPRRIIPLSYRLLKRKIKRYNLVWDFDDSIIGTEISKKESGIYLKYAKRIVVSTPYLKDLISESTTQKVDILCTTDGDISLSDIEKAAESKQKSYKTTVNMIWLATANNMPNLLAVLDYLDVAAKMIKDQVGKTLCLKVVCNAKVAKETKYLVIDNISWTHEEAIQQILNSHIGIMPLNDNEFARGKAGFKLIQYMAGALPVIASNVGYNSSIVKESFGFCIDQNSEEQWVKAVFALASDEELWNKYSRNSLFEWNKEYSYESHLAFWQDAIDTI